MATPGLPHAEETPERVTGSAAIRALVKEYFAAYGERNPELLASFWEEGAVDRLVGSRVLSARREIVEYYTALFAALPDFQITIVDLVVEGDRCAVRWRVTANFTGADLDGMRSNGAGLDFEGSDFFTVRDGRLAANSAFMNELDIGRQIGLLPAIGSRGDRLAKAAFNLRAGWPRIRAGCRRRTA